jgi:ATP-dependent RNA helicase DeaD
MSFESLGLSPELVKAVAELGYTAATEIQQRAIPILLGGGRDFVGVAQTGTGKTAAFVLPLLQKIDVKNPNIQALILSPTRELANQIKEEIEKLGKYVRVKTVAVYGGTPYPKQISAIRNDRPQIVVGTPGRIIDLMKQGILKFQNAEFLVLDEADEMLNMGFFDDVQEIISNFGPSKNMWMFSATMPRPILDMINKDFRNPEVVKIQKQSVSNEDIDQRYYLVQERAYGEALYRIIKTEAELYGIVFCRTKVDTKDLSDMLQARGIIAETLHGDLNQSQRDFAMGRFKSKKVRLMICTDVAARGIDVDGLTHVFNFGLPQDVESYVHRIGRTGRAGSKGIAVSLVDPRNLSRLRRIEIFVKKQIQLHKLPSIDILKTSLVAEQLKRMDPLIDVIAGAGSDFQTDATFAVYQEKFQDFSKEDFMRIIFNWNFEREFSQLDRVGDLNERVQNRSFGSREMSGSPRPGSRGPSGSASAAGGDRNIPRMPIRANCSRLFVNIGKDDGVQFMAFIDEVARQTGLRKQQIQNVTVRGRFSFMEIPSQRCNEILEMKNIKINNRRVRFEQSS